MPKIRFHKLAALVVLVGFAGWVVTGEFSSVGSAQNEADVRSPPKSSSRKRRCGRWR